MEQQKKMQRKRRDREAIRVKDLDGATLDAIRTAEPGERSHEAGRRLAET
jgi:hypothetical protein